VFRPTCAHAKARYFGCVKFLLALLVYLVMAVVLGWGILLAVRGEPWLLLASLVAYCVAFAKIGCLPSHDHG
jgi:hypothetical protein